MKARDVNNTLPFLQAMEKRMYRSLLKEGGHYCKKNWVIGHRKDAVLILTGVMRRNEFSGDVAVTLSKKWVVT